MSSRSEKAMDLFRQGYNCAQAVFAAFAEDLDIDFETAVKISSSFGGGMGKLREVCGAVSGMFSVAGMKYGYTDPKDKQAKAAHYERIQELGKRFKEENQSIVCRELLGLGTNPNMQANYNYKKRPCIELVGCAAKIMEDYINEEEAKRIVSAK